MAVYPVKWFSSDMQGAPSLGDTADGALSALIKAVLVTGFGTLTINALSFDAAKGWAVATFSGGHAYQQDSVIQVDGVSPAAYNGEHRVMQVSTTQVWFELDGGNPAAAGSGASMTMKVAPLGWTITHESADGKIFIVRPTNVSESGNVSLRIDNSAWSGWTGPNVGVYPMYLAKVAMVEDVVDLSRYTEIYENRWPATGRYSNKRWDIIGDGQMFYFMPAFAQYNQQACYPFGYIKSVRPGDRYHAVLDFYPGTSIAATHNWSWSQIGTLTYFGDTFGKLNDSSQRVIARPYTQLFGSTNFSLRGLFSLFGTGISVPNGPDNAFYVSSDPIMVLESGSHLRGYMPGLVNPYGSIQGWDRKNFKDLPALPGKMVRFVMVQRDSNLNGNAATMCGFDITGPWR
ncbi:hypothetical protein [Aeromonas veronii]|uniref:hypothetical protein n=1 Tax=Aeromonas veronii TaxID=654 RepID=UPI002442C272|nr:hypothetical protein [Aeromonas veronii]